MSGERPIPGLLPHPVRPLAYLLTGVRALLGPSCSGNCRKWAPLERSGDTCTVRWRSRDATCRDYLSLTSEGKGDGMLKDPMPCQPPPGTQCDDASFGPHLMKSGPHIKKPEHRPGLPMGNPEKPRITDYFYEIWRARPVIHSGQVQRPGP